MKVLLDEDLDHRLRKKMEAHEVFTVRYLGWSGLKNGELLTTAEQNGIEVFVTADQNLAYQQNLSGRLLAIIVLSAANWPIIKHHIEAISAAIDRAGPRRGPHQLVPGADGLWVRNGICGARLADPTSPHLQPFGNNFP